MDERSKARRGRRLAEYPGFSPDEQLAAGRSKPPATVAKPAHQAAAAKQQAHDTRKLRPQDVYGVIYRGAKPKPKPLPQKTEPVNGDPRSQALAGAIKRSLAWANSFYGKSVLDTSADNSCSDRGANRWSCAVTVTVLRPFKGYRAGNILGGYTVTLDPTSMQLTYASGLS
jgi:hypothetical protein